jgi:hypothetical protein
VVDPTGLKPAPHGLKGRRSVTRAPGQQLGRGERGHGEKSCLHVSHSRRPRVSVLILAVAEGFEPSHGRINSAVPYQLGYATKRSDAETRRKVTRKSSGLNSASPPSPRPRVSKCWLRRRESNSYHLVYKTSALEPIELRRKEISNCGFESIRGRRKFRNSKLVGGLGGIQTLTGSLQDFNALCYITSPRTKFRVLRFVSPASGRTRNSKLETNSGGCGWIRTNNLALMRRLLSPFELHSHRFGARGRT